MDDILLLGSRLLGSLGGCKDQALLQNYGLMVSFLTHIQLERSFSVVHAGFA